MRISDFARLAVPLIVVTTIPALALDGEKTSAVAPSVQSLATTLTPVQAFRAGTEHLRAGDNEKALAELRYAAEQGHPLAQWRLARMYADGEGVKRDDAVAFGYFSRIASEYAETAPWTPHAAFVANAYVSLGSYYLRGIPDSPVHADAARAYGLFSYAASYFGDADAQYRLARLYIEGQGAPKDMRQGARWLGLAAQKGQYQAQALLGHLLFRGEGVPQDRARGLMWLTLGRDTAAGPADGWIVEAYEYAFERATDDERTVAYSYLRQWLQRQR
jgi:hypothetical protein